MVHMDRLSVAGSGRVQSIEPTLGYFLIQYFVMGVKSLAISPPTVFGIFPGHHAADAAHSFHAFLSSRRNLLEDLQLLPADFEYM